MIATVVVIVGALVVANRQYAQPRHLIVLYPFVAILGAQGLISLLRLTRRLLGKTSRPSRALWLGGYGTGLCRQKSASYRSALCRMY